MINGRCRLCDQRRSIFSISQPTSLLFSFAIDFASLSDRPSVRLFVSLSVALSVCQCLNIFLLLCSFFYLPLLLFFRLRVSCSLTALHLLCGNKDHYRRLLLHLRLGLALSEYKKRKSLRGSRVATYRLLSRPLNSSQRISSFWGCTYTYSLPSETFNVGFPYAVWTFVEWLERSITDLTRRDDRVMA